MKIRITHKDRRIGRNALLAEMVFTRSKQKVMIDNHALKTILVGNALLAEMK